MKTKNIKWFAYILTSLMLLQSCNTYKKVSVSSDETITSNTNSAQQTEERSDVFVRVFDMQGKKIEKGKIITISDTSLELFRKRESTTIDVRSIGFIKTKRSIGHNFLVGAVAGTLLGIATVTIDEDYSWSDDGRWVFLVPTVIGAIEGGLWSFFKNSKTIIIKGDLAKWQTLKTNWESSQEFIIK
ncbi:MAG: hypothetical protein KJO39_11725 [Bacteroidia bacterium]|nr:hypothetical protein [Bacteroidia bacterium]NNF31751.1 hypothetical protein [Flavobacteriaceae bacterium]NNK55265.1 hypothetical protein [Flavobacteriaceae bacterium]NNM10260.1 hypothetical protein [Flavobacteriaceae bacterium]